MPEITDQFHIIYTADKSPSLIEGSENSEAMHNSRGALSESLYIYGHCIDLSFQSLQQVCCASVGLGLGYNEMIFSAQDIIHKNLSQLYSFEINHQLSNSFLAWVFSESTELSHLYEQMLRGVSTHFCLPQNTIKDRLKQKFTNQSWQLLSAWPNETLQKNIFNCVLLDLYSRQTCPHLWEESFLESTFKNSFSHQALIASYSSNGNLNRTLTKLNFKKISRKGFSGKRESTLAFRGLEIKTNPFHRMPDKDD